MRKLRGLFLACLLAALWGITPARCLPIADNQDCGCCERQSQTESCCCSADVPMAQEQAAVPVSSSDWLAPQPTSFDKSLLSKSTHCPTCYRDDVSLPPSQESGSHENSRAPPSAA